MVKRFIAPLVVGLALIGCGSSDEATTQRAVPLTVDEQIANIEKRTDMPDHIKAQTIASLRQQAAAQAAAKKN